MSDAAAFTIPPELSAVGTVVDHSPAASGQYIGSPSIAVLPNHDYVVSHDLFGPGSTNDTSLVFRSGDRGRTWEPLARVAGQWWSTLFWHGDALYWMGASRQYGHTVIRR
ncbi:MAG: exo-alpha-sialidase, partial [Gemmatimonadota bacterium]